VRVGESGHFGRRGAGTTYDDDDDDDDDDGVDFPETKERRLMKLDFQEGREDGWMQMI